jgi:hypothetical protein
MRAYSAQCKDEPLFDVRTYNDILVCALSASRREGCASPPRGHLRRGADILFSGAAAPSDTNRYSSPAVYKRLRDRQFTRRAFAPRIMPPLPLAVSETANSNEPGSILHIRRRVGSMHLSFDVSWESDSNETASNLPGPGRPLGQLLSTAGRRLEAVVERTVARAGLGFEGIARRLLMKLRAPHAHCHVWPEFARRPVVELAMQLASGRCDGCNQRYTSGLSDSDAMKIGDLILRLVPSIE